MFYYSSPHDDEKVSSVSKKVVRFFMALNLTALFFD